MVILVEKLEPGYQLPFLQKIITFDHMKMYSACTGISPHTDEEYAKEHGRPTALAQGLMSHVYMIELLTRAFGKDWYEGGKINSTFLKPVYIGDHLYIHAKVADKQREAERTRVSLELWVMNQRGETTTVATASVLVGSSA